MYEEALYTVKQVAVILQYDEYTVRKFIRNGRIRAFRVGSGPKSPYRISWSEVERLKHVGYEENMKELKKQLKDE